MGRIARAKPLTFLAVGAAVAIIGVGAVLRFAGLDWGRPYVYHPDEYYVAKQAFAMVSAGDPLPHNFFYPSLLIDLQAFVTVVLHAWRGWPLTTDPPGLLETEFLRTQFPYVLAGRAIVAMTGVATIVVTIEFGRRLAGWTAGLAAGLAVAVIPLSVVNAHYLTTDVPSALICALCGLATLIASRRDRYRWWLLAALLAGLAGSTKWNGLSVVGVPLLALLLQLVDRQPGWFAPWWKRVTIVLGGAAVGLVVATPGVVLIPNEVAHWLALQVTAYQTPDPRQTEDSLLYHVKALRSSFGAPALLLVGFGFAGSVRRALVAHERVVLTVPAFAVAYFLLASVPARHYERNLMPIIPYLAVALGLGVAEIEHWVRRTRLPGAVALTTAVIVVALALWPTVQLSALFAEGFLRPDTRTVAREWVLQNIPRGTEIRREWDTPQFSPSEYPAAVTRWLSSRSLDEYREAGVRYLIASSLSYGRFLVKPPDDPARQRYERVFELPEVLRIDPRPGDRGPTIRIFRLDP
jgi:4-amino-4-deoxy-L-arabinose transferase-like glycosyltransferase